MILVTACICLAAGAGFTVQGNMSEAWVRSSLKVMAGEGGAKLLFSLPEHSGATVVAKPDTGASITARLNMPGVVDLRVPTTYEITVTRDSGAGQWTCKTMTGDPVLLGFGSSADAKHHARATCAATGEKESWRFTWPQDATFLVRALDASGKVTDEQDLSDSDELDLYNRNTYTLEVAPTDGSGEFTATKSE